jgi:tripartite-type tricarboxylate transporter receptor subunit TctC
MNRALKPALIAMCALSWSATGALAADISADYFKGKVIRIAVGTAPGGLYDQHARLMSRYLGKHLAGTPNVIVENVPGAGSLKAALSLYNAAAKDGTALGVVNRGLAIGPLIDPSTNTFDARKFNWLGSTSKEVAVGVTWHTAPVKTFDQLATTQAILGATGLTDDSGALPTLVNKLFDTKIKIVTGYTGGTSIMLAMEKGEVQGRFWSWGSVKSERGQWLTDKKINLFVQMALEKAPDLPDTPFIMDYTKTDEQRQVLRLALLGQSFAWPMAAPPGVPAPVVAALRAGYRDAANDPTLLAEGQRIGLSIVYVPGDEINRLIDAVYETPQATILKAREIFAAER